ncbi:MAG: alpha/beta hydrolase [Oligoflexia bacterium]|nr:alpha/beta hydrolase [Oligoflexia bacterium]
MSYFQSSSGKVFFGESGVGDPLVFIHGRTLDSRMWKPQVDFLKSKYRCITYDLSGFGKSDLPKNGYDPVQTLKELFDHLNLSKATVIALSLGTHVAINFALEYPNFISKLVLMSCTVPGAEASKEFMEDWDKVESAGNIGDFLTAKDMWLNCKAFQNLKINNKDNYKLFLEMINDYTCWDIHNAPSKLSRPGVVDRLAEITASTLVVSGEKDYSDFVKNGDLLGSKLPNSKVVKIKESGHMINFEFPDVTNKLILDFLSS